MSEQRVTDAQAKVFAGYDADGNAWYTADPALREKRDELTGERMAEFEWLRDLALDLLAARALLREAVDDLTSWRDDFAPDEGNECLTDPTQEWLERTRGIIERGNALLGKEGP